MEMETMKHWSHTLFTFPGVHPNTKQNVTFIFFFKIHDANNILYTS